jgi:RNA polymerase sigma-70 factor (ECF subfamily)
VAPTDLHQDNQPPDSDRDIFLGWMAEHRGIIVKIVRGFTTDSADADDLTQEITLALWQSIRSFRGESKASTWIWRIALNRAISWQRGAGDVHADLDDVVEPATPDHTGDGLLVDRIYDAIRTLAPIDRSLIMLSLEGHRYAEIADITGLTDTNVGARLSRARAKLTEQLEDVR